MEGSAISDLLGTCCLHTMYLPIPTTMQGARRIEIGNHSFNYLAAHEAAISEWDQRET
jgi:hypothetical protein